VSEDSKRKGPVRVAFWVLMIASCGALAFIAAVASIIAAMERLRHWTDGEDVHPGPIRRYTPSDFGADDGDGGRE
jgi:hypothetical protein